MAQLPTLIHGPNVASGLARGKREIWRVCPDNEVIVMEVVHITCAHNSLARASHITSPNHKEL